MTESLDPHMAAFLFPTRKRRLPDPILDRLKMYGLSKLGTLQIVLRSELDEILTPESGDRVVRLLKSQHLSLRNPSMSIKDRISEVFGNPSRIPVDFLWFPRIVDTRQYQECINRGLFTCGDLVGKKPATWHNAHREPLFTSDNIRRIQIRMKVLGVTSS
jgi:hypothetical protein